MEKNDRKNLSRNTEHRLKVYFTPNRKRPRKALRCRLFHGRNVFFILIYLKKNISGKSLYYTKESIFPLSIKEMTEFTDSIITACSEPGGHVHTPPSSNAAKSVQRKKNPFMILIKYSVQYLD